MKQDESWGPVGHLGRYSRSRIRHVVQGLGECSEVELKIPVWTSLAMGVVGSQRERGVRGREWCRIL